MQRVNPEDAVRLHEIDVEAEKNSARLNTIINVAAFIAIVGALRIGTIIMHKRRTTYVLFMVLCYIRYIHAFIV